MPSSKFSDTSATQAPIRHQNALLDDICALTAMPFPNLLYRVLANNPAHLETCWHRVRPGLVLIGANRLRERLVAGATEESEKEPQASGFLDSLTTGRKNMLTDVLNVYNTGNSCNSVLVKLLLWGTHGDPASELIAAEQTELRAPQRSLPPMMDLDAMTPPAQGAMKQLAAVGDPEGDVVPSLFRHFGQDEELLSKMVVALRIAVASGALDQMHQRIITSIDTIVAHWPVPVEPINNPEICTVIDPFSRTIPRMLAVSGILRS